MEMIGYLYLKAEIIPPKKTSWKLVLLNIREKSKREESDGDYEACQQNVLDLRDR